MNHDTAGISESSDLRFECGALSWAELLPHFARGVVVRVAPPLNLVAVARAFRDDDTNRVTAWLQSGNISRASDDDARRWNRINPMFRAIVVAPWVLVQELAAIH